ncbi:S10 family peptidase [Tunturiibacter gelidoferens]|jgi:carboxypeptidase C (cathepsin A)|uniref:Carboxypeptidase C (Cathepsin A) n=1 Tax=Tunturiibacter gelidiferens TaxID=3069689 RepID=A0A9X0QJK9_9BACT|nr:peptidase S10 [Edaphobacter lichenicola]MBB5331601.1 carboxypeptidase C (cathepsin A) [Edaphobacter lichenicola]
MSRNLLLKGASCGVLMAVAFAMGAGAQEKKDSDKKKDQKLVVTGTPVVESAEPPADSTTEGSVTVGGEKIAYRAVAGTLTVGSTDSQDAMLGLDGKMLPDTGVKAPDPEKPEEATATARMFYVAYFKKDAPAGRPVTFLYNGGPGSATMWLHMGSFGPKRVVTTDAQHDEAAPYKIVNNDYSLLDVSDVVFIDAPGTGFSRIMGEDKEKAFWGVDQDAHAFDRFIRRFLTKFNRWNSPKYLMGESYGTPRSAVLSAVLQNVDLNGIVLLSQILSFDNSIDGPKWNPGVDQAYALGLPTFAASAFYHHKLLTQPAALEPFLAEVEQYALGDYMSALLKGSELPEASKQAVAEKLHQYTGLPVAYLMRANLRVTGAAFSKQLQLDDETTTGRLDTRYKGPDIDPLSSDAEYDPQSNAISSAYTAALNHYMRTDLKYGENQTYKPGAYEDPDFTWDLRHQPPGGPPANQQWGGTNVMPDLAYTMKSNPKMKVMLAGGYYDLATPYFEGKFEMHHLQIPQKLQANISYHYYQSGHMVYVNEDVLKQFHADVAAFIRGTEDGK